MVIALGRTAKKALGDAALCNLPHPKAIRRFGDSGEIGRKLKSVSKRISSQIEKISLDHMTTYERKSEPIDLIKSNSRIETIKESQNESCLEMGQVGKDSQIDKSESKRIEDSKPSEAQNGSESLCVPISKADGDKKIVYGVVLDPYMVDSQNDYVPPSAIETTAHEWLAKSRIIGFDHTEQAEAYPVESSIIPYPSAEDYQNAISGKPHRAYRMPFGDDVVHSGSWVLGTKFGDSEWDKVQRGEINAYSIGGYGKREPITRDQMPDVEFLELKEDL